MPFGYIRSTPIPSGSINIWWLFFDENLKTLSSMEGQYLGPIPEMFPEYMAERCVFSEIILWVSLLVLAI